MLLLYLELVVAPDGEKDLSNPHPSCSAVGLAIGTPHSSLEPEQADLNSVLLNFRGSDEKLLFLSGVNCHKSWLS